MALDPNIALGVRGIELQNPLAQYGQVAAIQNAQNQNALAQFQLESAKRQDLAQNALSAAYQKGVNADTGEINNALILKSLAQSGAGHMIPDVQAKLFKSQQEQAALKKTNVETTGLEFKQRIDKANKAISDIAALNSPEEAMASIDQHLAKGDIDQQKADMLKGQLAQAPNFGAWQKGMLVNILDAKEKLTLTAPKPTEVNLNNKKIFLDLNPNSPTFQQEIAPAQTVSMTPGETALLPIRQQTANAATSQATTARGRLGVEQSGLSLRALQADPFNLTGAQAAFPLTPAGGGGGNAMAPAGNVNAMTPRPAVASAPAVAPAAPADTISGRQMPLGEAINKGITGPDLLAVIPKSLAGQVSAILEHRAAPPSGNTTRSSQLMQIVQAADPTYDAQQYKTKQGIETAFTVGLPSRTLKSINVADDHLKVLNSTIDALQNGNVKAFNQLGNTIATQFGSPAPTDFNGVKTIVADELVKAILGGAGALGDRKAIQETINSAMDPTALRSMIKRYQELMDGQRTGLAEQYKSGGGNNANVLSLLNKNKPAAAAATGSWSVVR